MSDVSDYEYEKDWTPLNTLKIGDYFFCGSVFKLVEMTSINVCSVKLEENGQIFTGIDGYTKVRKKIINIHIKLI